MDLFPVQTFKYIQMRDEGFQKQSVLKEQMILLSYRFRLMMEAMVKLMKMTISGFMQMALINGVLMLRHRNMSMKRIFMTSTITSS